MNELIKITYDSENPTISGRELHKALEVETPYRKWFPRMCEYGFEEGKDFNPDKKDRVQVEGNREVARDVTDHILSLAMAKELAMLQRNEKGKQVRRYLIAVEEQWNSPDAIMQRALNIANERVKLLRAENSKLSVENTIMAPKADYFDELVDRNLLTNFRETAKQISVKERDFISFLLDHKYIYRDKRGKLMPYANKNDGLFEIKECFNEKTEWSGTQTLITPKGRETFRLLMLKSA